MAGSRSRDRRLDRTNKLLGRRRLRLEGEGEADDVTARRRKMIEQRTEETYRVRSLVAGNEGEGRNGIVMLRVVPVCFSSVLTVRISQECTLCSQRHFLPSPAFRVGHFLRVCLWRFSRRGQRKWPTARVCSPPRGGNQMSTTEGKELHFCACLDSSTGRQGVSEDLGKGGKPIRTCNARQELALLSR